MQCPSCGIQNSARVKFCAECGTPIGIPCPSCGFRNSAEAKACGGCGRISDGAQTPIAERRQLTVFFADLAGSTALAEKLDPEDLHDLIARYQSVCAEAIQRYEGHLAQYLGDGVLAYFGYPAAHEDDAARAVRAGLDILARIGGISAGGYHPHVRIGIHTGLVVVGGVGEGIRQEQLALGEAPNIAARVQSEAAPDSVVVSDATVKLLAGQFQIEDLGSRTLKGISRPMKILRVLGRSEAPTRFHAMKSAHGLTPFVGRENEVASIRTEWETAAEGQGRVVILSGEAGIGKSRLLEAVAQIAVTRLHEVFVAQCSPFQMNTPLHPIVEMLERRTGMEKEMPAADKLDLLEQFVAGRGSKVEEAALALAELFSIPTLDRYPEITISPARRRQWSIEILAGLLLHSVGGSPVLLLCEDLHWADPSTLDLLGEMAAKQADLPVLIVCTTRPGTSAPWFSRANCRRISVESLPIEDTRDLVARIAGPKPLPLALREELVARTGGIPLFVEAVTRTVLEAGILRELDDRYELTGPLPPGLIPATVQDSLMGRIDRLGADRPVAQLAATIGRESSFELLQAVLDRSADDLTRALNHLIELDLVSESGTPPESTYKFKHALIQDAAYESLLRKTRQEFHGRIADVVVQRFPAMAERQPELLGRHFEGAGKIPEAISAWMKAARLAQQVQALRECTGYCTKAISLLETQPADDLNRLQIEFEAQSSLAAAINATLGWASREAEAASLRVCDLCRKLGNIEGLLGSLTSLAGGYTLRGAIPQAIQAAQTIVDIVVPAGDPSIQVWAHHVTAVPRFHAGEFRRARGHAEKALEFYTPERERALVAQTHMPSAFACCHTRAMVLWIEGYPEQSAASARYGWSTIETLNIPACTTMAKGYTLHVHYLRRDHVLMEPLATLAYEQSTKDGSLFWSAQARIFRAWARTMNGDTDAGIAELKNTLEIYRQTGSGLLMPHWNLMLAEAQWSAGLADEALAAVSAGLAHSAEFGEHCTDSELHTLKGVILSAQGATKSAEASFRRAIEVAQEQGAKMFELQAALALAKLQKSQGRIAEARELLQPLNDWFKEGRDLPALRETAEILESLSLAQGA